MRTPLRIRGRHHTEQTPPGAGETLTVGIRHDRYTVAFHLDTCQMWVLDSTGSDTPRGPYPSGRQAWVIANELNSTASTTTARYDG